MRGSGRLDKRPGVRGHMYTRGMRDCMGYEAMGVYDMFSSDQAVHRQFRHRPRAIGLQKPKGSTHAVSNSRRVRANKPNTKETSK